MREWNVNGCRIALAMIDQWQQPLPPAEEAACSHCGAHRRQEFTAGRALARRLSADSGFPASALLRRADGVPLWPEGIYGSISHSRAYICVALAPYPVGIDIEHIDRVRPSLLNHIATAREQMRLAGQDAIHRAILFSAKEAYYKLQYPQTGKRLGFLDVEMESADDGTLQIADAAGIWLLCAAELIFTMVYHSK